jgi:GNAT superfamily N-acetyltransferase
MNEPVIRVRRVIAADARAIGEAHGSAWEAAYGHIFEQPFLKQAADSRRLVWPNAIAELLVPPNFVLVAELDGLVLAYVHGAPAGDGEPVGEIHGFYSEPAAWGTGAATMLMDEACAILATTWAEVVLWTLQDAHRARGFYEKMGFQPSGREKREALSNWLTGEVVERPAVDYRKPLSPTFRRHLPHAFRGYVAPRSGVGEERETRGFFGTESAVLGLLATRISPPSLGEDGLPHLP